MGNERKPSQIMRDIQKAAKAIEKANLVPPPIIFTSPGGIRYSGFISGAASKKVGQMARARFNVTGTTGRVFAQDMKPGGTFKVAAGYRVKVMEVQASANSSHVVVKCDDFNWRVFDPMAVVSDPAIDYIAPWVPELWTVETDGDGRYSVCAYREGFGRVETGVYSVRATAQKVVRLLNNCRQVQVAP